MVTTKISMEQTWVPIGALQGKSGPLVCTESRQRFMKGRGRGLVCIYGLQRGEGMGDSPTSQSDLRGGGDCSFKTDVHRGDTNCKRYHKWLENSPIF